MANALERGLDILEYLITRDKPSSLEEISSQLNIPRTSCFRILKSLENKRYIQLAKTKEREQRWELTYKLSIFADIVEERQSLRTIARPIMEELADDVHFFVQLGILVNDKVMYIDDVKLQKVLRVYAAKFSLLEIHACAAGLVLASYLPEERIIDIIEHGLVKKTEKTITDEEDFKKMLTEVREKQYAIDDEYYARGIKCVAAPIFNHRAECLAAVGVTGHSEEFASKKLTDIISRVKKSAADISKKLEFDDYEVE